MESFMLFTTERVHLNAFKQNQEQQNKNRDGVQFSNEARDEVRISELRGESAEGKKKKRHKDRKT